MENIIEIEGLEKSYGDVKAVDGITFNVKSGSLFAFLGVNGAGKSTTINILCSILIKDKGKVTVWKGHRPPRGGHKENYGNSLSVDHAGR